MKSIPKQSISYGDYFLKQHKTIEYLRCYLDSNHNRAESQWFVEFLKRLTQS